VKFRYCLLLTVLGLTILGITFHTAWTMGVQKGVDMYHQQCYTGGLIVDEKDGTVVKCGPLGVVPKEELNKYKVLDKMLKV
jgi:hypothetical protein